MLVPLAQAARETCGGKAAALGVLLRDGLPVPDGFVVPFDAYRETPPDDALRDALDRALRSLGSPAVAVRSSAAGEDTAESSAAGQHESVLAVHGPDDVAHAVRTCWASLRSPRATAYRNGRAAPASHDAPDRWTPADGPGGAAATGLPVPTHEPAMAVLVQRLVDADVAGVLFTPATAGAATEVEASWGLGPSVVGGSVSPDRYRVAPDGAVVRAVGDKATRLDRAGGRLVARDVPPHERGASTLDDATAVGLARLGQRVADLLGGPQDVEWAIVEGRPWILQARPVTASPPSGPPGTGAPPGALRGTAGSSGVATGPARIVRGPGDFSRVRPGDILVCPFTDPAWTPLLRIAAGVVTDVGGVLSHAAIVARERRIPAVLGVVGATGLIADGDRVTVDGAAGTVLVRAPAPSTPVPVDARPAPRGGR